jgi:hypothetical protein
MRDGGGQRVGGIGRRCLTQTELGTDHEGDLLFLRGTTAHGGLFDLTRGVFVDRQAVLGGGDQARATRGAEHDGCFEALHENRRFNGANGGRMLADDLDSNPSRMATRQPEGQQIGFVMDDAPGSRARNCPPAFSTTAQPVFRSAGSMASTRSTALAAGGVRCCGRCGPSEALFLWTRPGRGGTS